MPRLIVGAEEINKMEISILKLISEYYPVSFSEIRYIYEKLKSFDSVIKIIELSLTNGVDAYTNLDLLKD